MRTNWYILKLWTVLLNLKTWLLLPNQPWNNQIVQSSVDLPDNRRHPLLLLLEKSTNQPNLIPTYRYLLPYFNWLLPCKTIDIFRWTISCKNEQQRVKKAAAVNAIVILFVILLLVQVLADNGQKIVVSQKHLLLHPWWWSTLPADSTSNHLYYLLLVVQQLQTMFVYFHCFVHELLNRRCHRGRFTHAYERSAVVWWRYPDVWWQFLVYDRSTIGSKVCLWPAEMVLVYSSSKLIILWLAKLLFFFFSYLLAPSFWTSALGVMWFCLAGVKFVSLSSKTSLKSI